MKPEMRSTRIGSFIGIIAALVLTAATPAFLATAEWQQAHAETMADKMKDEGSMMEEKPKHTSYKGQIANVQLGDDGQPEWIQSGIWVLRISYKDNAADPAISFIARIMMIMPDGTSAHMHTVSRFSAAEYSTEGTTDIIEGTATVTIPTGPAENVPVTINIINGALATIWIGPEGVDGHFGTDPIYATVFRPQPPGGQMMDDGSMMEKPTKLTETNLPVKIPLTRGFADGSEVFYISTEASDQDIASHLTNLTGFRVAYAPSLARAPASALANIYAFTNGIEGSGPLGFQSNVADSQPGDPEYSPLWRINMVEWQSDASPRELTSEEEILAAHQAGDVIVTPTEVVVNCPFVKWEGGSLQVREDKILTDDTAYGGGQVLEINSDELTVTFVAHRGFAPDGSTIYYIATDASVKEVADMLGVIYVNKTGETLLTGSSSDLWVFTNGIEGTGPMGFQASIAGSNVGEASYSPMWRIVAATWSVAGQAEFLTTAQRISAAGASDNLTTEIAGVVVNCPFVEVA